MPPPVSSYQVRGRRAPRPARRGAVLIVALLVAAILALILAGYVNLNLTSARLAKRSFNGYAALNLAESGAEEALWSFNRVAVGDGSAWDGWSTGGAAAWQKFPEVDFGANQRGALKVYVDNRQPGTSTRPKIVTQASIAVPGDRAVTKMIEVSLRRRSYFANGLVAKERIVFSGQNASADSWDSDPDDNPATAALPYSPLRRKANVMVASASVLNTAVLANKANVWGYVATGGAQPRMGAGGSIAGPDTPLGVDLDPRRISTDFNADLPLVPMPLDGTVLLTLGPTLGTTGQATKWRTPNLKLSGNQTLTILGQVTLILTDGAGANALDLTGNAAIVIPDGASLTLYVQGDIKVAGKGGLNNANVQPITCQIWGTSQSPAGQAIQITGNGSLSCALYAPLGDVTLQGNGDFMGSIVARNITVAGNAAFHYDESIADRDNDGPFGVARWRELTTASDQAIYENLFKGW